MGQTRHAVYDLYYHIVFAPTSETGPLSEQSCDRLPAIFEEICTEKDLDLVYSVVRNEYVHVYVASPPRNEPSLLANWLKGISARKYNHQYEDTVSWKRSYFIAASGEPVTKRRIEEFLDD